MFDNGRADFFYSSCDVGGYAVGTCACHVPPFRPLFPYSGVVGVALFQLFGKVYIFCQRLLCLSLSALAKIVPNDVAGTIFNLPGWNSVTTPASPVRNIRAQPGHSVPDLCHKRYHGLDMIATFQLGGPRDSDRNVLVG